MYELLDSESQAAYSEDVFVSRNKNIYNGIEAENITISNIVVNEDKELGTATITYDMSMDTVAGEISFSNKVSLTRNAEELYCMSWSSNLIYPDLDDTERVRVGTLEGTRGKIYDRNGVILAETIDGVRTYTYGEEFAHLIGYVQVISQDELEEYADKGYTSSSIIGKSGLEQVYEDRLRGTNGSEIYITDSQGNRIQTIAKIDAQDGESIRLTIDVKMQKYVYEEFKDAKSATVVMNTQTGEILALCSTPSYDINTFITGMTDEEWYSLATDSDNPLNNRYQATYVSSSSFEPIISAIEITTGVTSTDNSWSSALTSLLNTIGFNTQIPCALSMNASQYSNSSTLEISVNPVHMASIYSAFANDGDMILPYIEYKSNATAEVYIENAFSKKAAEAVAEDLTEVIADETDTGWYIYFADEDASMPYMIVSVVEDVENLGGSTNVASKVKSILEKILV